MTASAVGATASFAGVAMNVITGAIVTWAVAVARSSTFRDAATVGAAVTAASTMIYHFFFFFFFFCRSLNFCVEP